MSLDDFETETVEFWPENKQALEVFDALGTQWRMGMNGPIGLDYSVLPIIFSEFNVSEDERKQLFDDIRVMERAALAAVRESQGF